MEIRYENYNFRQDSLDTIDQAVSIIDDMAGQGYTLTLRQLYYQFVAQDLIPNTERSYKNLGNLITKARMAGLISWNAIEDRNRSHHSYYFEEDISTIFDGIEGFITYDLWKRQEHYVEVWIEKDALSNVLDRPCKKYQVPYMACKGYLSASEAWRAGRRFLEAAHSGKNCILFHLGDHDPSGIDMTRDNGDRLDIFAEAQVEVRRLALNMDQVDLYKPPPNPAKVTDSRSTGYIDRFGRQSWELDALKPQVIEETITEHIKALIDWDIWNEALQEQKEIRETLSKLPENVDQILDFASSL